MFYLNKIAFALVNPLLLSLLAIAISVLLLAKCECKKGSLARKAAISLGVFAVCSLPVTTWVLGVPLERPYPMQQPTDAPEADAIVVLGGGMGSNTNALIYANMQSGADRVWAAAQLYHAGKAPIVIATGCEELNSTKPLLSWMGVPDDALIVENDSRNTEENAAFTQETLLARLGQDANPRILLVTSAWHMRRSELMFARYAPRLSFTPFAADYEATCSIARPLKLKDFIPAIDALKVNTDYLREHVGYWGYKLLRK